MNTARSNVARRREVRRHVPRPAGRWFRSIRRRDVLWMLVYVAVFTALASMIALPEGPRFRYQAGQVVSETVTPRVAFESVDAEATRELREEARQAVVPIYLPNEDLAEALEHGFERLLSFAHVQDFEDLPDDAREELALTAEGLEALRGFSEVDEEDGEAVEPRGDWEELVVAFMRRLFERPILSSSQYREQERIGEPIVIQHPGPEPDEDAERRAWPNQLIDVNERPRVETEVSALAEVFPEPLRESVVAMVLEHIEPTYRYTTVAQTLTEERREEAAAGIEPQTESFELDDVIVHAGQVLDEAELETLKDEEQAYLGSLSPAQRTLGRVSTVGVVLLIALGIWAYILQYNPRVVENPNRGFALIALLVGAQAAAAGLTQLLPEFTYNTALFPTLFAAVVITIAYNQRFALGVAALHTLLVVFTLGLSVGFGIVLLAGVAVAVALLWDVRSRSTVAAVGLWSGLAMGAVALMVGIVEQPIHLPQVFQSVGYNALFATATGIVTGLLVQGILPTIEKVFRVTTAMTLRELNDASHPLLQRLAQEAPGTYQHSLRIADMAEAAAETIGGNALLCRVGAMYHDIGKINKPQYFIENQSGGPNRHAKLSPAMSLLIIVGHVKDGIEMAREYRLPAPIRHFIESHHGTTLVEYFYHAARKQKEADQVPAPSEFEFRYPGPKPQTKEAAILLLCDTVEAAARSLPEPTPVRLEQTVHRLSMKRLMDGQFDECNLTLQELHRIEQGIIRMLTAIYHGRVKYPGAAPQPPAVAEQPTPATPPRPEPQQAVG